MTSKNKVLKKFIEESLREEFGNDDFMQQLKKGSHKSVAKDPKAPSPRPSKSNVKSDDFTRSLEKGDYKSVAMPEAETTQRKGSSRYGGTDDESELTPEKMAQQSKLAHGDTGINKKTGSVHDVRSGGWLDPKFLAMAGALALHPQVGKFLDRKLGKDKINKFLGWAKKSHMGDLKSGKGAAKGDFKNDFGQIIKSRKDLFDQFLGQGVADEIMDLLFTIYQKKYKNLQK